MGRLAISWLVLCLVSTHKKLLRQAEQFLALLLCISSDKTSLIHPWSTNTQPMRSTRLRREGAWKVFCVLSQVVYCELVNRVLLKVCLRQGRQNLVKSSSSRLESLWPHPACNHGEGSKDSAHHRCSRQVVQHVHALENADYTWLTISKVLENPALINSSLGGCRSCALRHLCYWQGQAWR